MPRLNLDEITKTIKYDKAAARQSLMWFEEQARILGGRVSPQSLMANAQRRTSVLIPGKMYAMFYDPKYKETLPYYDIFPLIIPFSRDAETFTAINFHYLPTKMRFVLLKNLLDFATDKTLNEKTRLRMSWEFIGGISKYRGVNAAVKKYRYDHVASQFLEIPADQWFTAIILPTERFNQGKNAVYVNKKRVWQDSTRNL